MVVILVVFLHPLPLPLANNAFTGVPTVSVYGGVLPTTTATWNPYNLTIGAYSFYQRD